MTNDIIIVREWDADVFHRRVIELEGQGYEARLETYQVMAEMNPETCEIIHLHMIELRAAATHMHDPAHI